MKKSWDMQDMPIISPRRSPKSGPSSHSCCCVAKQQAFLALCLLGMAVLYCTGAQSSLQSQQLSGAPIVGDGSQVSANATTSCRRILCLCISNDCRELHQPCARVCTHICSCGRTYIREHACEHACTRVCKNVCTQVRTHAHTRLLGKRMAAGRARVTLSHRPAIEHPLEPQRADRVAHADGGLCRAVLQYHVQPSHAQMSRDMSHVCLHVSTCVSVDVSKRVCAHACAHECTGLT